jgi:hypothetical protein
MVEYVYPLPTDRQPDGGEVRLARFSSGAARPVASRVTNVKTDHMLTLIYKGPNETKRVQKGEPRINDAFIYYVDGGYVSRVTPPSDTSNQGLSVQRANFAPVIAATTRDNGLGPNPSESLDTMS